MSSAFLYLAIVIMWLCVLVPMWLRRDRSTFVETHKGAESYVQDEQPVEDEASDTRSDITSAGAGPAGRRPATSSDERRRAEQRRRAAQVAKRRRLTFWCTLLVLASAVTATVRVIPWWGVAPSVVLLGSYLAVLRVSVQIDAERRRAVAQARAERARRARRRAAELEARRPVAEIIDLDAHRDELFDQYAEAPRRAVGD
ncbi:divisome protein SepX/GlpR [Streptosporangium sp. CA-135522]|uniref:divisome protein SepX/GlpR n=1 Tax=Streptosporangium sp. CA-135522 TaxID=3240072 RepID=UPI003D8B5296